MNVKPILRFLFVPRTDSPTIAYYAGLFSGIILTLQVQEACKQLREVREMEASRLELAEELQRRRDNLKINPNC